MNIRLTLFACASFVILDLAAIASESVTQVSSPNGAVTTTVATPGGTTQITTSGGQSVVTKSNTGSKIEMDSDGSVYVVYPDGARVSAPDGVTTLMDGETVTVKDGKRIP